MTPPQKLALLATLLLTALTAHPQAAPTAVSLVHLSAFLGGTGTYTGFGMDQYQGRNLGITAGADAQLRSFFSLNPGVEIRGTYPVYKGTLDSEANILAGFTLTRRIFLFRPYADLLFGRGRITFSGQGYLSPDGTLYIQQTAGNVLSPGLGVDIPLLAHFSLKADFQYQRYATQADPSGHIYSKPITAALVYRFHP